MNSKTYWRDREDEALKKYQKQEKKFDKEIERIYRNQLDSIQKEINAFYGRYAGKEGITIAEAKKRVRQLDIAEYERKAKRYVKDRDFSDRANEEMRIYNLTMKINRLEMLKSNIGLELLAGHDELDKFIADILQGRTKEELERQAGILGKTVKNNAELAKVIPNASFHNATFSDRIWLHQNLLKAELDKTLQSGLIQGKNPRVLARELNKKVESSIFNAERLMRTELARVQTAAQQKSFEANGFEEYEYIANSRCCEACQAMDGKHFKVKDMLPGENAAPMHPQCRCSVAAYSDRKEYDEWLDFLANGGKTENWEKRLKIAFAGSPKSYKRSLEDILVGKAGLNEKRKNILKRLPDNGSFCRYEKGTISTRDLAYLSAATKNEFALFRSKKEDIIIRGTHNCCDIIGELADEIVGSKYEWVAHSHVDGGPLVSSYADRETLKRLGQKKSKIIGVDGNEVDFSADLFDLTK